METTFSAYETNKDLIEKQFLEFKKIDDKIINSNIDKKQLNKEIDIISVGRFKFQVSMLFEDININDKLDIVSLINMFYIELETQISTKILKTNFNSYFKLKNKINELNKNHNGGYIYYGNKLSEDIEEENDLVFHFDDSFKLNDYIKSYDEVLTLYNNFIDEIIEYAKKQIVTFIRKKIYFFSGNKKILEEVIYLKSKTKLYLLKIGFNGGTSFHLYVKNNSYEIVYDDYHNPHIDNENNKLDYIDESIEECIDFIKEVDELNI